MSNAISDLEGRQGVVVGYTFKRSRLWEAMQEFLSSSLFSLFVIISFTLIIIMVLSSTYFKYSTLGRMGASIIIVIIQISGRTQHGNTYIFLRISLWVELVPGSLIMGSWIMDHQDHHDNQISGRMGFHNWLRSLAG